MRYRVLSALIKMEIKKFIRQPANLFLNLLFPAVLTIVFLFAFSDPEMGMDINSLVPGLVVYAVIFMIMTIAQSFSSERKEGLLKRLSTTPMTSAEFMGSQIITHMIISIVQVVVVIALALLLGFRPNSGFGGVLLALPVVAIFALSAVGLGLITATISKTPEAATGISFIFILPQMFFGTFVPITDTTRPIAQFIPSYYIAEALQDILKGEWMNTKTFFDISVITAFSIIIVALGIILFKKFGNK